MLTQFKRVIILDDDSLHNTLAILYIKKTLQNTNINNFDIDILGFNDPVEGLNYIKSEYTVHPVKTILFLDINMPELNGWQVLEQLSAIPFIVKWFSIYILSSSVDEHDILRAHQNKLVQSYLEKPLSKHLKFIFPRLKEMNMY